MNPPFKVVDDVTFYPTLESFGHSERIVKKAIIDLSDKNNRLIEPVKTFVPNTKPEGYSDDEYVLTDKGKYYLDIAKWPEYVARFGTYGRSLIQDYKSGVHCRPS